MLEEGGSFVLLRPALMSMQLSELKGVCKQRVIPTSGSKGEIVERIIAAPAAKTFDMDLDSLIFLKKPAAHDGVEVFAFSGFPFG